MSLFSLIGIAGGSGSGKTTLARRLNGLAAIRNESVIISLDNYYNSLDDLRQAERAVVNFDCPDALDRALLFHQIKELKAGQSVEMPSYDFSRHVREAESIPFQPRRYMFVEGILALHYPEVRELMSYSVFVDTPSDVRFARRLHRDSTERGRSEESVRQQWDATVEPMFEKFCAPTKRFASEIVEGECVGEAFLLELWVRIQSSI